MIRKYQAFIAVIMFAFLCSSSVLLAQQARTPGGNLLDRLLLAVEQNDLDEVKKLTSLSNASTFLNIGNVYGENALILAAKNGNMQILHYLLYIGADVNIADKRGMTALMHSISASHIEITKSLLAKNANLNFQVGSGPTALIQACGRGFYSIVEILLNMGAYPQMYGRYIQDDSSEIYDVTPLMIASYNNHGLICDLLEMSNARVNPINEYGDNALLYAVGMENDEIVANLIKRSIDTSIIATFGTYKNITPLALASALGNYEIASQLIEVDKNVNRRMFEGKTALMWAVVGDNFDIVSSLVENGANVNEADNNGKTVLMYASEAGNAFIVKFLIEQGAALGVFDNKCRTALSYAMEDSNLAVIKVINEKIFNLGYTH